MTKKVDKREAHRTVHNVSVIIQKINDIYIYGAKMFNHSDNGMYLETNISLNLNTDVFIGIDESPNIFSSDSPNSQECYRGKIIWQKNILDSIYNFGYGVKIISFDREHPRMAFGKEIFFSSKNKYFKGYINNIGKSGVYIETEERFAIGQNIKLYIPKTKIDNGLMLRGEVVRADPKGIGVKFKSLLKYNQRMKDRGGRRSGTDRRSQFLADYIQEKRSDTDRRSGNDRRRLKYIANRRGLDLEEIS